MIFGVLNPEKILQQLLVHLPTYIVATLPWQIQKVIFQTHQKSLKSVNCWQSYLKNKNVSVFWDKNVSVFWDTV